MDICVQMMALRAWYFGIPAHHADCTEPRWPFDVQKATYSIGDATMGIPQDIIALRALMDTFDKDLHLFMGVLLQVKRCTDRDGTAFAVARVLLV